ncbi:MAG: hypothetical protein KHX55_04120 [Proteobacteria bacterium]|nr:hypothetical protein [Pseudomonadota bacterium]
MINCWSKNMIISALGKKVVASTVLSFYADGGGFLFSGEMKSHTFKKGTFYRFTLLSVSGPHGCILGDSFGTHQNVFGNYLDYSMNVHPAAPGDVLSDMPSVIDVQPGVIGEFAAADNFSVISQVANLGRASSMTLQIDELA